MPFIRPCPCYWLCCSARSTDSRQDDEKMAGLLGVFAALHTADARGRNDMWGARGLGCTAEVRVVMDGFTLGGGMECRAWGRDGRCNERGIQRVEPDVRPSDRPH